MIYRKRDMIYGFRRMIYLPMASMILYPFLHTRSVYHLQSRYHSVSYIIRDRRERISLKTAICFRKWLFSWRTLRDSNPRPTA